MIETKLQKEQYRMRNLDLNELNRYLQKIQQRFDEFGIAQDKDFLGRRIINIGNAIEDQDALPLGQLQEEIENLIGEFESGFYKHFIFFGG